MRAPLGLILSMLRRAVTLAVGPGLIVLVAASAAGAHTAPLRDGRVTAKAPAVGWAYACAPAKASEIRSNVPWIAGSRYDAHKKPVVAGGVRWPDAAFVMTGTPHAYTFAGNGRPVGAPTGVFPPPASDRAARYAGEAAALQAKRVFGRITRAPAPSARPHCIDVRRPVGIATDGVPILPAFDAAGRNAFAHEVQDRCGGRTDGLGLYYYRAPSRCLDSTSGHPHHSQLVGYARDGYPIFGSRGDDGNALKPGSLDVCHGHVGRVTLNGRTRRMYHYHLTGQFPYAIGCFHGRPARGWSITAAASGDQTGPPAGPAAIAPSDSPTDSPPAEDLGPEPAQPDITTDPDLFPTFDPAVTDYVTRCSGTGPVQVSVSKPPGRSVEVNGDAVPTGDSTTDVPLQPGRQLEIRSITARATSVYHVRCLPTDFPDWTVEGAGPTQASYYLSSPSLQPSGRYVIIFDGGGVPIWWYDVGAQSLDFKLLPGNDVAWYQGFNGTSPAYTEHRLDGTEVRQIRTVGFDTDVHELQELANGDYMAITYMPRDHVDLSPYGGPSDTTVQDGEIQELTPAGDLVWSWNTKDHIALSESQRWYGALFSGSPQTLPDGRTSYDIVHMNAIEPHGDEIILSLRHADAVYSIDKTTGAINWKLGGTTTPESLSFVDDPFASTSFGGQHDPRLLPDGTLTLHDNGTSRGRAPRAVRYRIDTEAKTATLIESITDSDSPSSGCCGSARKLAEGNWVIGWGSRPQFTEQTPAGEVVRRVRFTNGAFSYRTQPIEPGAITRSELRAGMDAMPQQP